MKFSLLELEQYIKNIFLKIGCSPKDANIVTEVLIAAELRGISSHGIVRISDYIKMWKKGRININPHITIVHETPSTAVVDGDNGLGMIVGKKSMEIAISKAKTAGTGWVSTRNSNHFSIAGYYAMMALEHDMIGITLTNANPLVAPTFSLDRLLGTNPIAVAIPAEKEPAFVADFATTPIARGKLNIMHKKGLKAPLGYVQDKEGAPSNDPNILTQGGAILPLGGDYEHGSHKGYCLGAVVDIFSSILSGASFGPNVPPSVDYLPVLKDDSGVGTGHFFGAMRIDAFQSDEEFKSKMDQWIQTFRKATAIKGQSKVLVPGDPERISENIKRKEGIEILDKVYAELEELIKSI